MEIVDVPDQVRLAFRYAARSWLGLLLSILTAVLVLAFVTDLCYRYVFARAHPQQDVEYGFTYLLVLLVFAFVPPALFGGGAVAKWRRSLRRFNPEIYGVAIVSMGTASLSLETLSASARERALEGVGTNFYRAIGRLLEEEEWAHLFEYRQLSPLIRITSKSDADKLRARLGATLVIWGSLVEQGPTLSLSLRCMGDGDLDMQMTGTVEVFTVRNMVRIVSLIAATGRAKAVGDIRTARRFLTLARPHAVDFDGDQPRGFVPIIDAELRDLDPR